MDNKFINFGKSFARPSTSQCTESRFVFGSSAANASASFGPSSSPSAFGRQAPACTGFGTAVGSLGNSTSAFSSSLAPTSSGFRTVASSSGSSTSSFAASVTSTSGAGFSASPFGNSTSGFSASTWTHPAFGSQEVSSGFGNSFLGQNGKGSRIARYTATPEVNGQHGKILSICAMEIHSIKSHEELRAEDYQLGDKSGLGHESVSPGCSTCVTGTQQNNSIFPASSSNTTLHPPVPAVFSNSFAPRQNLGTLDNGWPSVAGVTPSTLPNTLPWMKPQDANGPVFLQPNVAISSMAFPNTGVSTTAPEHTNPVTSNPFSSQRNIGGSTGVKSFQKDFTSFIPNSSGWQTSPVNAGIQRDGSRLAPYTATLEDGGTDKILSISAMPMYKNKSLEELRFMHYHPADKGGCTDGIFPASRTKASSSSQQNFVTSLPVAPQWLPFPPTVPFTTQKLFSPQSPGLTTSNTQKSTQGCFPLSSSLANQSTPLSPCSFNTSTTAHTSTCNTWAPPASQFLFSSCSSWFSSSSLLSSTSLSSASSTTSGISTGTSSFLMSNCSQSTQSCQLSAPLDSHTSPWIGLKTISNPVPQNISSSITLTPLPQNISSSVTPTLEPQSVINVNSSEALKRAQTSVSSPGTKLSIQFGISSRPVTDNAAPARGSSLLRVRHLSVRRNRLQSEKFNATSDGPKVAFFTEEERNFGTVKADSSIIPRNDPRCWISSPSKELVPKADSHVCPPQSRINSSSDGRISGSAKEVDHSFVKADHQVNVTVHENEDFDHSFANTDQHVNVTVHGDEDVDVVFNLHDQTEYLEAILPKLRGDDYYTDPSITEIAAKEKTEPGFCSRVKDFVVGRAGYGCIKFLGETDIRKLELDSIIEFNRREILVYFNESMEKPPVGQGLNKPAEVTLLNVECNDKKSGKRYIDGPRVDKYRERLIKKTAECGAEFVSYDPVRGEWKFKVQQF